MYRLDSGSEDEARFWNNILVFTFFNDFRKAFFPLDNRFQGFFRLDGSLCLYLYDYCPVRRNDKITFEGKKVSNAVWRFKSGEQTDLFVKLFSIAASRIPGRFRRTGTVPCWFPSRHPHGRSTAPDTRRSAASSRRTWELPTGTGR